MIQQTSLEAWNSIKDDLNPMEEKVFGAIACLNNRDVFPSDQEISEWMSRPINTITPRRNELEKLGAIEMAGYKLNKYGRRVCSWRLK